MNVIQMNVRKMIELMLEVNEAVTELLQDQFYEDVHHPARRRIGICVKMMVKAL